MIFNCPDHGLNCPYNFSNIRKLVLKNNRIGKPFGASADINRLESLLRKMLSLTSNNIEINRLKGASSMCEMTKQKQQSFNNILKLFNLT